MDGFQHALDVLRDVVVPEAQHAIAFCFKPTRPFLVGFGDRAFCVL